MHVVHMKKKKRKQANKLKTVFTNWSLECVMDNSVSTPLVTVMFN